MSHHIDIDHLTENELVDLNCRIVQRLKFLESVHHHQEMMKFTIGDKVSFEAPGRGRQIGTLIKYNQKSVSIITESGQKWNVSPALISKIKSSAENNKNASVVAIDTHKK